MNQTTHPSFKAVVYDIYTAGLTGRIGAEQLDRMILLNINITVGILLLIVFGTNAFLGGHLLLGAIEFGVAGVLVAGSLLLRATGNFSLFATICAAFMAGLFGYLTITGGVGNTGILWTYTFPLFISFIFGYKKGLAASIGFLGFTLLCFALPIPAVYDHQFKVRFAGSFICVIIIAYIYEYVRTQSFRKTLKHSAGLETALAELSQTRDALTISEQRLRDVLLSSSDWIWEINAAGCFTYVSDRVNDALGYTADGLIGKDFLDIIPLDERIAVQGRIQQALTEKKLLADCVTGNLKRDGQRVWVLISAVVVLSPDGSVTGMRGVTKDISVQKRAEEDRAMLEEKFRTAQKMEAIGQLAGGIAHDFNNILGAISGYAEMIRTRFGDTDVKLKKYADTILSASSRAADLTAKLLAFARRGKFQNVPFNVHHTIDEVTTLLQHSIDKRIEISAEHHASNAIVQGDPIQIQNALMNLGINGCDAMAEGGKLIFDSVNVNLDQTFIDAHHYEVIPGDHLLISITDTGTGMDNETKTKLFQPFFTTKDIGKGTGLGLASVYGIIKSHNGYINVYSEVGYGTTFKIYLPCAFGGESNTAVPAGKSVGAAARTKTGRIMIIDDEQFILDISTEMLELLGFSAITFHTVAEALAYYREHHTEVQLVIIDMIMPQANGRECFQQMRTMNPGIRAVLSTGLNIGHEVNEILAEGFIGTIQKPFVMSSLASVVLKALNP